MYNAYNETIASLDFKGFTLNFKRGHLSENLYYFIDAKGYCILNLNSLKLYRRLFKDQLGLETVKYARINRVNNEFQISGQDFVGVLDAEFNIETPFFFPKSYMAHFGLIDASKTMWCASFNNGVFKIPYNKKDATYSFTGQKVQALDLINNALYVSVYDQGFFRYNRNNKTYDVKYKQKGFTYGAQYIDALKTQYFLSKENTYSNTSVATTLPYKYSASTASTDNERVRKLAYYKQNLYGLFAFGMHQLDPETFSKTKTFLQKGTADVLSFNNSLYVATTNGLKVLEDDTLVSKNYQQLLHKSILSLEPLSKTQFLINTDGFGAYIATDSTLKPLKGSEYLSVQNAFVEGNAIWLATNKGVLHYEQKASEYVLQSTITTQNGLPLHTVNDVVVYNDFLFAATDNGLVQLPKHTSYKPLFLDVYLDAVWYNAKPLSDQASKVYTANNTLEFKVATIDFTEPAETTFKYKLLPNHEQWNTATSSSVNFTDLAPNDYQFIYEKNGVEKQFNFTIQPLWWQTLTFRLALGFGVSVLLLSAVWWISKSLQKQKDLKIIREKQLSEIQLKALRSQMNPHFVFNTLAAIQYYISENDFEASETYLVKFSKLVRQFFELSKEHSILLKDEIQLLKNYLDIEILRFKDKLSYTVTVDDKLNVNQVHIPTMLLQPIVENAVNHGIFNKIDTGCVRLIFSYIDSNSFKVCIEDDGVGFANTTGKKKHYNSSNVIADRIKFLNQTQDWQIQFHNEVVDAEAKDQGNRAIFLITKQYQ